MSAALLAGEPGLEAVFGEEPRAPIEPRQLHLFGVRSLDRGERELLRARGVNVIDMRLISNCYRCRCSRDQRNTGRHFINRNSHRHPLRQPHPCVDRINVGQPLSARCRIDARPSPVP